METVEFAGIMAVMGWGTGIVNLTKRLCPEKWKFEIRQERLHIFIPKYDQQDAKLHSFFISVNFSTCFGWIPHPSSGA